MAVRERRHPTANAPDSQLYFAPLNIHEEEKSLYSYLRLDANFILIQSLSNFCSKLYYATNFPEQALGTIKSRRKSSWNFSKIIHYPKNHFTNNRMTFLGFKSQVQSSYICLHLLFL